MVWTELQNANSFTDEVKSTDLFGSVDLPVGGKSTDPQSGWMDDDGRVLVHPSTDPSTDPQWMDEDRWTMMDDG